MSYNEEKGSFVDYAYSCMECAVWVENFYAQPQEELVSYSDGTESEDFAGKLQSNACVEDSALFRQNFSVFWKQLDQRAKKIVQMLVYGYKQSEIADTVGCTQSYVSKTRRSFFKQIEVL